MRMEFTFDEAAVLRRGYTMQTVHQAMKNEFAKRNLVCVEDGDVLAFEGTGNKNDYSSMLNMMRIYSRAAWFMDIASSWVFRTRETKGWEDVLVQAKERFERRAAI